MSSAHAPKSGLFRGWCCGPSVPSAHAGGHRRNGQGVTPYCADHGNESRSGPSISPFPTPTIQPGPSRNVQSWTATSDLPTGTSATCASDVLPQRHDRKEADDADGDEGAFNDTGDDIAEGEVLVLPFEDRKQLFLGELIWTLFVGGSTGDD